MRVNVFYQLIIFADSGFIILNPLNKSLSKKAHAIAYHMCGGDWEEARDLTQEAFLKVFRTLKKFRHNSSFYTWFYRIGTRRVTVA